MAEPKRRSFVWRSILIALGIAALAFTIAFKGGSTFGGYLMKQRHSALKIVRNQLADTLMAESGTFSIGQSLPDWEFLNLEAQEIKLSSVVQARMLVMIFDPDCSSCLSELETIKERASDTEFCKHLVLISSANPIELIRVRKELGSSTTILYDRDGQYILSMKIPIYPLNLTIDKDLTVKAVLPGALTEQDLKEVSSDLLRRP